MRRNEPRKSGLDPLEAKLRPRTGAATDRRRHSSHHPETEHRPSRRKLFRTLPRFETATEPYALLSRIVIVGVREARAEGAVHRIDEVL